MIGRTTQSRAYSRVKFKIYSTMFLYSKERKISTISIGIQKVKPVHNKGQDTIVIIHGISLSHRWSNRENESRIQSILVTLC